MAVNNSQLNVALRILSTFVKGSAEVCAVREKNRNLLHILALNAEPGTNDPQLLKVGRRKTHLLYVLALFGESGNKNSQQLKVSDRKPPRLHDLALSADPATTTLIFWGEGWNEWG